MRTQPPAEPPAALSPEIENAALDWFVRRSGGGIDAAEEAAFQAWLAVDGRHPAAFAHWQRDWNALDALPAEGLRTLRKNLAGDKAAAHAPPQQRAWWRRLADLAPRGAFAAALLFAVAGGSHLAWSHWQQQPVFTQSFATARGQQLEVILPDGSRLGLDTATLADVTLYRQRRELRLPEGQTVLQVKGDAARPFDVLAGPLRITVVGTRFSVRYTPGLSGKDGVWVAVEEGRVRVAHAGRAAAGTAVEIGAGQQVVSDAAGVLGEVSAVSATGIAPWRTSRISFDSTPLAQALAEFERYGPTGLVVRDPSVAALRVTGTFDPHRLDNFSRVLPQVLPVQLREKDGVTEIVPGKS